MRDIRLTLTLLLTSAALGCASPDRSETMVPDDNPPDEPMTPAMAGRTGSNGSTGGTGGARTPTGTGGSGGSAGTVGTPVGTGGTGGASSGTGGASGGTGGAAPQTGGRGGSSGTGGAGGSSGVRDAGPGDTRAPAGRDAAPVDAVSGGDGGPLARFSFFYTSLDAMRRLSGSQNGFGGDLRFGTNSGLEGADKICQTIAAGVGFGGKTWRAFLSVLKGPDGNPVHAIDRIGDGPWYDRRGRLIAMNKAGLVEGRAALRSGTGDDVGRPVGDPAAVADLPDETGQGTRRLGDTHDVITGSNVMGRLQGTMPTHTCNDWTSTMPRGPVQMGHAWPAGSGRNWIVAHPEPSCAAGVNLVQNGPGNGSSIGAGGGWGGFYCFALTP